MEKFERFLHGTCDLNITYPSTNKVVCSTTNVSSLDTFRSPTILPKGLSVFQRTPLGKIRDDRNLPLSVFDYPFKGLLSERTSSLTPSRATTRPGLFHATLDLE